VGIQVEPYSGDTGPAVTFQGLGTEEGSRVVGIDLTGSESRPSGWCLLDGSTATTLRLKSDEDIIDKTLKAKPTMVSIDSPLSLPNGRMVVEDSDPGRSEFGIMRECERILKRRGINVYPCLLPSMQRLTQRGISLALRFRKLGIPVIESYPGAAQDILRIPRKQAGLNRLIQGLERFGIEGEFIKGNFSHDELDAITSALVGLFFLAGKFEALGSDLDENLIVPDITHKVSKWGQRIVIGLSGQIASGKTTAGAVLKANGFEYARYSIVLAKLANERGMPGGRDQLQSLGQEIFETKGQYWLGRQLLPFLPPDVDLVIDGLRHPEDLSFWAENFGPNFHHIHVAAEKEIRRQRYIAEGNDGTIFDNVLAHEAEVEIPKLEERAHTIIYNEKTKETFAREVLTRVQLLRAGKSGVEQCQ
jgi:predicted nuclease with RNAse H fold/dephospho-CoA kinase